MGAGPRLGSWIKNPGESTDRGREAPTQLLRRRSEAAFGVTLVNCRPRKKVRPKRPVLVNTGAAGVAPGGGDRQRLERPEHAHPGGTGSGVSAAPLSPAGPWELGTGGRLGCLTGGVLASPPPCSAAQGAGEEAGDRGDH